MNYLKIYCNFIRKAKEKNYNKKTAKKLNIYLEEHHIFPVSIFGKNTTTVFLTAREHYIAHALLEKIYIKRYGLNHISTKKMIKAFFGMNNLKSEGQVRYTNSHLYEYHKKRYIDSISGENNHFYGRKRVFTEEHLEKLKLSRKYGKDNPLYGVPRSEEVKRKISEKNKGRKWSEESKLKLKESKRNISDETRKKLSNSHRGQVSWNNDSGSYLYKVTNPQGEVKIVKGLGKYCRENNLLPGGLYKVASGKRKQYRGYIASKINN